MHDARVSRAIQHCKCQLKEMKINEENFPILNVCALRGEKSWHGKLIRAQNKLRCSHESHELTRNRESKSSWNQDRRQFLARKMGKDEICTFPCSHFDLQESIFIMISSLGWLWRVIIQNFQVMRVVEQSGARCES